MTRQRNITRVDDRTKWAIMHMGKAALLRSVRRGYHEITDLGRKELYSNERITTTYLMGFPVYRRWKEQKRRS